MEIKTPFSDAIEKSPVPTRGTTGGQYDSTEVPGGPGRTGGMLPELYRDHTSGTPGGNAIKTPFKDSVK